MILWRLLPSHCREAVAGDIEEIWRRGGITRRTWWRLAVASIAACWIEHLRHRVNRAPSVERPAGDRVMQTLVQDVVYGLRLMRRAPGFTAAAVLTLGLGIGVNAATFSIVDILSLKPLNYRDPSRVAFILTTRAGRDQPLMNIALADAMDIGRQMQSLERVAAYQYWSANLTGAGLPERIQAYRVTANTFALLGVDAAIGRTLAEPDGLPEAADAIVLSDGLWRRRFGADPAIVGTTVTVDGAPHTVVGVMPRQFEFPIINFKGEAWGPMKGTADALARRPGPSIVAIARLRPTATYQSAQAELATVMRRLEADHPDTNRGLGAALIEMRHLDDVFQPVPISVIALSAVAVVLLLACANVANLLLARAAARERELAVRAALGAGRTRLVRQLLTESALLAVAGSALGLSLAFVALRMLRGALPELLIVTWPNVLELGIDRLTLTFTLLTACLSALLFGGVPAWQAARGRTSESLKSGGHGSAGPPHRGLRTALMIGEVALSLVLLVAAGLLVRTFGQLQKVDPGFNADRVLTLTITLPEYRYKKGEAQQRFFVDAIDAVSSVPGVVTAGFVNVLPFSTYDQGMRYVVEDGTPPPEPGREPATGYRIVTDRYFAALEIPVLEGRAFDSRDRDSTAPVAIVNRTLARRAFGDLSPIGRRIRMGRITSRSPWLSIVGVIGDVRHAEVSGRPEPELYVPVSQASTEMMMLAAKTVGNPEDVSPAIQRAIATIDPLQPVYHVKSMRRLVDEALLPQASAMSMMTIFALLAFLLATIGVYGVISYIVSQQTREFGVRLALGASPSDLMRLVLRRGLTMLGLGAAIGSVVALGVSRLLGGILYGVTATDWPTYAAVGVALLAVGGVACYVPARRATRLDPAIVLRAD